MFALPVDPRVIEAYERQTDSFQKAAALFQQAIDVLKIPYENTTLPGYFIKPDSSNTPRKTLLCTGGYDGTCAELFFSTASGALKRGLSVRVLCIGTLLLPAEFPAHAEKQSISQEQAEALVSALKFQQGEITANRVFFE